MSLQSFRRTSERHPKVWGAEFWLVNNEKYCMKILDLNPGFQCSLHRHNIKTETFLVESGTVKLEIYPQPPEEGQRTIPHVRLMGPGEQQTIHPGEFHRFSSNGGATILEISTTHSDEDVERKEESRAI